MQTAPNRKRGHEIKDAEISEVCGQSEDRIQKQNRELIS